MALLTDRKFIHFNRKSDFEALLNANAISDKQIVFLKDAQEIWTHGTYYGSVEQFLDETNKDSTNAVSAAAVYQALADDEEVIAAALNDLNDKYTNLDSSKQDVISDLDTIRENAQSGASKVSNVQADWDAESGLAQILHKPDLSVYENEVTSVNGQTGAVTITHPVTSTKQSKINYITGSPSPNGIAFGASTSQYIHFDTGDFNVRINSSDGQLYFNNNEVALKNDIKVTSVNGQTGDVIIDVPSKISDLTDDLSLATLNYVDDKLDDVLGISASGVEAFVNMTRDEDTATGILTEIVNKAPKTNAVNGAPLSNTESYFYGTSTTAAATVLKEVSIPSITSLKTGQIIVVKPTITSTVANSTIKLNNFTAYPMRYNNAAITTSTNSIVWAANIPSIWVFDGTYWVFLGHGLDTTPGTLNTTATTAQSTSSSEALNGNIILHKVSKTGSYSDLIKPSTGIPKTDLASAVQTSLGKADASVQNKGSESNIVVGVGNNSNISVTSSNIGMETENSAISIGNDITLNTSGVVNYNGSRVATATDLQGKQDVIRDLQTIRDGAADGATAIQGVKVNGTTLIPDSNKIVDITIPEGELSNNYEPSSLDNEDLELAAGDTYEEAFGKLEKSINDNELITAAALTDLDSRINTLHLPQSLDDIPDGSTRKLSDYATTTLLATKQDALVSGTNIKTINNESILGSGNITIQGGSGGSGDENVIEIVKVNGTALTPDANKAVDVTVPTESTVSGWGFTKNTGTYSKPSGGIPKTDLASAVQTSLGKADTALQSYTETDPTVPAWAKAANKPSYTAAEVGALPDTTTIPAEQIQADWNQTDTTVKDYIKNKPNIRREEYSGGVVIGDENYFFNNHVLISDSKNSIELDTGGDSGINITADDRDDGTISLTASSTISLNTQGTNKAFYNGKEIATKDDIPTVPAAPGTLNTTATTAQTTSSSEALSGNITLHKVAKTGTYNDLIGKPTIPTVNNATLTIQKNGTTVNTFTANASSNVTANIQVNELPTVSSSDNGKVLQVVNGAWSLVTPTAIYSGTSAPDSNTGNNGDIYLQTS